MSLSKALKTVVTAGTKSSKTPVAQTVAKWGAPTAALTVGAYAIPTAASAGLKNAFGIDPSNPMAGLEKIIP